MNLDLKKIRIPTNYVLVKLDPDFDTYHSPLNGNDTKIHVAPWGINQASHVAVTGVVMALPERLIYNGYYINSLKEIPDRSESVQREIADLRHESMAYDVPMQLQVGLRVYFEYTTRLNAFKEGRAIENDEGKFVFIPYDMLIMAFKPDTNPDDVQISDVYMLNGMVLIKPLEYATERSSEGVVGAKTESDLFLPIQEDAKYVKRGNIWYGNVLTAGCGVKSYADFPGKGGEHEEKSHYGVVPGMKICYDGRQQRRLEVEHHRVIFKKHRLYRIHRKDVIGWFPDGKIS